jgi:hypothetical protein
VRFSQVKSGAESGQSPPVRPGYARWNDRENDQPARRRIRAILDLLMRSEGRSASHHALVTGGARSTRRTAFQGAGQAQRADLWRTAPPCSATGVQSTR